MSSSVIGVSESLNYIDHKGVALCCAPPLVDMSVLLFKLAVYALVALACVATLAVLRHWLRQRILQKIPGPSNPSLFWGKIHQIQTELMLKGLGRSLASHVQSFCIFIL